MSPTAECAAQTLSTDLKATDTLPKGRVSLVVAVAVEKRQEVLLAHVSIPERGDAAASTTSYDDGRVVVDRNEDGQIIGVEFNALKLNESELPEFHEVLAGRTQEVGLLRAAYVTAMFHWARMKFFFDMLASSGEQTANKHLRAVDERIAQLRKAVRAQPEMRLWRSWVRDDSSAFA